MIRNYLRQKGISPVVGVILLVAITVVLVTLATVIVFDIGSDVSESSDITVQVEQIDEGINFNVIRNNNVNNIRINGPDEYEETFDANVGDSKQIIKGEGEYTIVTVLSDGSEETIQTTKINSEGEILSGTASINPPIEDALIRAYDDENTILGSGETNEEGEYSISVSSLEDVERTTLSASGASEYDSKPLYASAEITDIDSNTIDFNFDSESVTTSTVNGEEILISNKLEGEEKLDVNLVSTLAELQAINEELDADYKLVNDIDASETSEWNDKNGFEPIGERDNEFTGKFYGNGYTISNVTINRPNQDNMGLFGRVKNSTIKNVGLVDIYVEGDRNVGGLIGYSDNNYISNTYTTGNIIADGWYSGGLIGYITIGEMNNSYSEANISGNRYTGGLVGREGGYTNNSYATGDVNGGYSDYIGGLVGENRREISNSYATGDVMDGDRFVGGLVGLNRDNIYNSYSVGDVQGQRDVGGFIGTNYELIENVYFDKSYDIIEDGEEKINYEDDGKPLKTSEMQGESASDNIKGFDFTNTWATVTDDYPELQWQE